RAPPVAARATRSRCRWESAAARPAPASPAPPGTPAGPARPPRPSHSSVAGTVSAGAIPGAQAPQWCRSAPSFAYRTRQGSALQGVGECAEPDDGQPLRRRELIGEAPDFLQGNRVNAPRELPWAQVSLVVEHGPAEPAHAGRGVFQAQHQGPFGLLLGPVQLRGADVSPVQDRKSDV